MARLRLSSAFGVAVLVERALPGGEVRAAAGIDAAPLALAPGGQILEVDHDAADDPAGALLLLVVGLRALAPLLEARLQGGIGGPMGGISGAGEPGDANDDVRHDDTLTRASEPPQPRPALRREAA